MMWLFLRSVFLSCGDFVLDFLLIVMMSFLFDWMRFMFLWMFLLSIVWLVMMMIELNVDCDLVFMCWMRWWFSYVIVFVLFELVEC